MINTVVEGGKGGRCSTVLNGLQEAKVMPYEKAERIAAANNKDDPEWDYIVEKVVFNDYFWVKPYSTAIIRVHDEQGLFLGWL